MFVSATVRSAVADGFRVVLAQDAHATNDVDAVPAAFVARHALGDEVRLTESASIRFRPPAPDLP
jgi:nicotinamidase-related amidase